MKETEVSEIVKKVYEKARENCISNAHNALAKYVENKVSEEYNRNISHRTVERAFSRYIDGDIKIGFPQKETIISLCNFLGFNNYEDYKKNKFKQTGSKFLKATLIIAIIPLAFFVIRNLNNGVLSASRENNKCMTWADSTYVIISCSKKPYSKYGTKIEPLEEIRFENFKKLKVNAAYPFFTDDGKPLVWYYKKENGEIEYFSAPGLHPTNGKTLRKITAYIIDKYVPIHSNDSDSFLK